MGTIIKCIGSKNINLDKYNISNYNTYVEPFGGSFRTGFKLIESGFDGTIVYNDKDDKLVNFFEILQRYPGKLYDEYISLIDELKSYEFDVDKENILGYYRKSSEIQDIKRAAAEYIYKESLTLNGLRFKLDKKGMLKYDFEVYSEMLKKIVILNLDYYNVMQVYDSKSTFMLIDPPYLVNNVSKYYEIVADEFIHNDLAKLIHNLEGSWLLTYNDCEYIRNLYKDYNIEAIQSNFNSKYRELFITRR